MPERWMMRIRDLVCLVLLSSIADIAQAWQGLPTDANLITAIDVSGSVKADEERLQLEGMAAALVDPRFMQAIERGRHGRIGFTAFTWASGEFLPLVPWTLIGSRADAEQVALRLVNARELPGPGVEALDPPIVPPWRIGHATDVSAMIEHATGVHAAAPFAGDRAVLNICANGTDNVRGGPRAARDRAARLGLTVNGLVLGHRHDAQATAAYFREQVQTGQSNRVASSGP